MEENKDNLTPEQEKFCQNYTQNTEFFGNATLAYADAFGFDLDSQVKNDAQYQNSDGEIYAEYEFDEYGKYNDTEKRKCKKIQDSSYERMYNNCSSYGSKLIKRDYIQKRCNELLNKLMENNIVDARLIKIILKGDDKDAIQAIREYNRLKQRILDKVDVTSDGKVIGGFNFIRNDSNNTNN